MKDCGLYFRKYGVWMVLSYVLVGMAFYSFALVPRRRDIDKLKAERSRIEYDWTRMKNSRNFFVSLSATPDQAGATVEKFDWLNKGYDPNLVFFEYISSAAEKTGLQLMALERTDGGKKEGVYYTWKVACQGTFGAVLKFLREMENGTKYVRVEQLLMKPDDKGMTLFEVTLSGLKKVR
jgi:hypothetical protein